VIERLVTRGNAIAVSDGSRHDLFPVAIDDAEGQALRGWVTREGATRTIEVGLGYGISALFICEALVACGDASARHMVIDPHQTTRFSACGLQFLDEAGVLPLVDFASEESQVALPRLLAEGRTFDFAFVDGNHRFDGVFLDLVYLGRLVKGGGIVFVDDYQLSSVARAASFCRRNLDWKLEEVSPLNELHQWAVLRTPTEAATRSFDHFVEF
jgi:predicted O-methyltransferase YrrM